MFNNIQPFFLLKLIKKLLIKKYFHKFCLLFIFIINPNKANCQDPCKLEENCQFYLCEETKRNCGKKGYLINYGYKYCTLFNSRYYKRFSKNGQEWVNRTTLCLQNKLNTFQDSLTCSAIKKKAIKGHLDCCLESGYCKLTKKDKRLIFIIVAKNPRNWIIGLSYLKKIWKYCIATKTQRLKETQRKL